MNSTHSFSLIRINSSQNHYFFTISSAKEKKIIFFSNARDFERRVKCLGAEVDLKKTSDLMKDFFCRNNDLAEYGNFDYLQITRYKISFSIKSTFLNGKYILLNPAWGRHLKNKMWLLIPSSKLK